MQPQPEFNSYYNNSSSNSKSKTATTKTAKKQQESEEAATAPKLQQQQSDKQSTSRILRATTSKQQQQPPRVIKSKQPLINFRFYLDIRDHQLTKYIEKQIQLLGGTQEFFLDANITHFVTDKAQLTANSPVTPTTPNTPQTPTTTLRQANSVNDLLEFKNAATNKRGNTYRVAQTRANAILSRVRVQSNSTVVTTKTNDKLSSSTNYIVWQTEYAVRFLKKVQHELKAYLQPENRIHKTTGGATGSAAVATQDITQLKGGYIKFESFKLNCRPYYHSFRAPYLDWPKVSLKSEDGAFSLTANKPSPPPPLEMTRKSRSRSSQCATPLEVTIPPMRKTMATTTPAVNTTNKTQCRQIKDSTDKQCGVCEICKVEYDTLTIHLKTKDHEYFARNTQNFIALDTLIQTSADVNKFLAEEVEQEHNKLDEEMEQMEVEVEEEDAEQADPLEQPLSVSNLSPPLRERSKRSTKGKHSSEKFQNNKRTKKATPIKTAPKTTTTATTPTKNNTKTKTTRRKPNANSSSPIRPFPPPSSLYKVVETSQVETTPRRGGIGVGAANVNENVTASPSLIVKIKKVRNTALLRLNGEAESFMFPKTTRRASSDLPTDVDRQSSSERLRNSIYSSSSLDSSSISDILVNLESPELNKTITTKTTTITKGAIKKLKCFQSAPIQPNEQLTTTTTTKSLRSTPKATTTTTTISKLETTNLTDLSPPSAAAAIVAATAKISLPAATRKSSRMATAIVSAATTSSRILRAAAEVVKKSGRKVRPALDTVEIKQEKQEKLETTKKRQCRLSADLSVVKMEDGMGDSDDENEKKKTRINKSLNLKTKSTAVRAKSLDIDEDYDDEDDDYDVDNDDKMDKDFKCRRAVIKPRSRIGRRGRRKKSRIAIVKKPTNKNSEKIITTSEVKPLPKSNKSLLYDYTTSEKIKQQNYAFERVPESDLWYRVFKRQDNCEETYFEYFANTKYHKLPYEMGPIPYTHTKLSTKCCKLCQPQQTEELKKEQIEVKCEKPLETAEKCNTTPYALKHKKLHLLQRYRQEQEALLLKEKEQQDKQEHCYTKSVNLSQEVCSDLERRERAGSTQSTSSSCASTNTAQLTKKSAFRNKLLQKAALLNLELPPRKSPREHASTLALVSIIKQRQESKPNSDVEEVQATSKASTPIPKEELRTVTPVEEMCFATEISENVKRMRRGRNKYDHSPPYVLNNTKRVARQKLNKTNNPTPTPTPTPILDIKTEEKEKELKTEVVVDKRKPRKSYAVKPVKYVRRKPAATHVNMLHSKHMNLPPSVRKTGQKKGVLEFSVDESALKALDADLEQEINPRKLEFEIDNFLQNTGKELDMDELSLFYNVESEEQTKAPANTDTEIIEKEQLKECFLTPPATDYFSSDFDLCDLLQDAHNAVLIGEAAQKRSSESKKLSVYNTMALKKYFRKRKYMKSNRTGWPKIQKKKYSMRHQTLIANELKKQSAAAAKAVITPPDSEGDAIVKIEAQEQVEEAAAEIKIDDEEAEFYHDAEEEDTRLDSIAQVETEHIDEYERAVEADDEDEFNDENTMADKQTNAADNVKFDEMAEEEEEDVEPKAKRCRRNSSLGKALANCLNNNQKEKEADEEDEDMLHLMATTSTPSTNLTRSCRRTPQLNGSLISCNSPLERADNSDIFTVSSDGLDTDLDLTKEEQQVVSCKKSNKYDITKYVKNPAANTCAAEAATAAAKSLAIAQFLKKEVRVTCRRIRAPFRRFRYRR